MSWLKYLLGLFIKDVAPILLKIVKSVVMDMANTDLSGEQKKAAAMAAVKAALIQAGVEVTDDVIDGAIEDAVNDLA